MTSASNLVSSIRSGPFTARRAHARLAAILLLGAQLNACTFRHERGHSVHRSLRLDSESAARLRHASVLSAQPSTTLATQTVASTLVRIAPLLLTVLRSDQKVDELQQRIQDCVRQAETQVNASHFGGREPTREECGEEVEVDGCGEPITQAMRLGMQKHALALACTRTVLDQLWPARFSIEQRYRYFRNARFLETVSHAEEQRLIAQGCTRELWRTLKPDVVLHPGDNLLEAVLILDFKFPCPSTNTPAWKRYGKSSAYDGMTQGELYLEALGGKVLLLAPRGFF